MDTHSLNVKIKIKYSTLQCILCSNCPTIYVNKHLSRLTYGRAPAKGSNQPRRNLKPAYSDVSIALKYSRARRKTTTK